MPNTGGIFGTINDASTATPQTDPNAFQYGGHAGGAAARQGQLSALGQMGANGASNQPYQNAQMGALGLDQQAAMGNAPSVAQAQLQQGLAQSQAGAAAQAAGSRGGGANLAAAQNQAANTQAGMAAQANNQSAQLRAQEMATARGQYGDLASQGLGQQMGWNQSQAQLQQGYEGMNNQIGLAQLGAQGNQQALNSQNQLGAEQLQNQQGAGNADRNAGLISGVGGAVGGAAGAVAGMFSSDERAKGSIQGESGGRYMSSPVGAKNGIQGESSWMPGMNNQALGQAQLAAAPSNALHLKGQQNVGMNAWIDQAMAKPWSPQAAAADANVNKVFFSSSIDAKKDMKAETDDGSKTGIGGAIGAVGSGLGGFASGSGGGQHSSDRLPYSEVRSDTRAKRNAVKEDALKEAADKMQADMSGKRNGFEWMRDQPSAEPPSAADEFMETARPYTYDYKNPAENGGERRLGIMAQNLEQGPTGGDLVKDTPRGKVVDVPALASANSAAVGRLHDRVSALEASAQPSGEVVMPARAVRVASLAPEEHGNFSVFDNATRVGDQMTSDSKAKKDAIFQSGVQAGAAATQMAPRQEVQQLSHASSNPEEDDKWRAAISAPEPTKYDIAPPPAVTSHTDLPAPPDPRFIDPDEQARQMNAKLAAWNQGAHPAPPASFRPVVVARAPQSGGVFAQRSR